MICPQPLIRLAPITSGLLLRNPRVLLGGSHQPTLLRYLEGWPKRWAGSRAFRIQFVQNGESLNRFARDSFDLAVIQGSQRRGSGTNSRRVGASGAPGFDHSALRARTCNCRLSQTSHKTLIFTLKSSTSLWRRFRDSVG
jgi:hypothetical protein